MGQGINASEIGAFVEIAVDAGKTEVRVIVGATVLVTPLFPLVKAIQS